MSGRPTMNFKTFLESYYDPAPINFKNMIAGDFPAHASSKFLSKALEYIKDAKYGVEVRMGHDWDAIHRLDRVNTVPSIEIGWTLPGNFFTYYNLLRDEDKEEIGDAFIPLFKKIDKEFSLKTKDVDWTKKFEVRTYGCLKQALDLGADLGNFKFISKVNKASAERYHKLNGMDSIRDINKLKGNEQRDAIHHYSKNIQQALSQLIVKNKTR